MKARDRVVQKESILVELLQRERERRMSPEAQAQMERAESSVETEWMDVATEIQEQIVAEHNAQHPELKVTLLDLRLAAGRHPEIAFWEKYNRARRGDLQIGDKAPDVPLYRAGDGQKTSLLMGLNNKKCVVIAGSWS